MNHAINALYYAPGLDAAGVPVRATFLGRQLRIDWSGQQQTHPVSGMAIKTGGFDGRQCFLEWPVEGGRASLMLPTGTLTRDFLAGAPPGLTHQVGQHAALDRRRQRRFHFALVGLGVLILMPLLLLALFWLNADRLAAWAVARVSVEHEQMLGELAFAQMRPTLTLRQSGPALKLVETIGTRLTRGSRYRYRWFVADSAEVNAFALPAGYIVVYTGLLKAADSVEELAGVLAHEVQHVELRHSLRNLVHSLGWRALLAFAVGDVSATVWGDLAQQLAAQSYSRDLERQADSAALHSLRQAGFGAHGMLEFFARMAQKEAAGMALLASHPAPGERLSSLRQAIAVQGNYPHSAPNYPWQAVKDAL